MVAPASVVPLCDEPYCVESLMLRQAVLLPRQVDLIPEVFIRGDLRSDLIENSRPAVLACVVEPLDIGVGNDRVIANGDFTRGLDPKAVAG